MAKFEIVKLKLYFLLTCMFLSISCICVAAPNPKLWEIGNTSDFLDIKGGGSAQFIPGKSSALLPGSEGRDVIGGRFSKKEEGSLIFSDSNTAKVDICDLKLDKTKVLRRIDVYLNSADLSRFPTNLELKLASEQFMGTVIGSEKVEKTKSLSTRLAKTVLPGLYSAMLPVMKYEGLSRKTLI